MFSPQYLDSIIAEINETDINHKIHSIIIKLRVGDYSVGRMSRGGSYTPYYTYTHEIQVPDELQVFLAGIYDEYRTKNPTKRTLFFRYNQKNGTFDVYSNASLTPSSCYCRLSTIPPP